MKMVDSSFMKQMENNNGVVKKSIESKLREQQEILGKLEHAIKKGEKFTLNMYADDWTKIKQQMKGQ